MKPPIRRCRHCGAQSYDHAAIAAVARLAFLRQLVRRDTLKHVNIACAAGIGTGYFSMLWNGRRALSDTVWPRVRDALQKHLTQPPKQAMKWRALDEKLRRRGFPLPVK